MTGDPNKIGRLLCFCTMLLVSVLSALALFQSWLLVWLDGCSLWDFANRDTDGDMLAFVNKASLNDEWLVGQRLGGWMDIGRFRHKLRYFVPSTLIQNGHCSPCTRRFDGYRCSFRSFHSMRECAHLIPPNTGKASRLRR